MAEIDKTAHLLMKRFGSLESQRATWESHWQEIGDYVVTRKADITKKRSPGDKNTELMFDTLCNTCSVYGMLRCISEFKVIVKSTYCEMFIHLFALILKFCDAFNMISMHDFPPSVSFLSISNFDFHEYGRK